MFHCFDFGNIRRTRALALLVALIGSTSHANSQETRAAARDPLTLSLKIGSLERTAVVFAPVEGTSEPHPLVFVFHGHGGNARQASIRMDMHSLWPAALVVYPQGVPTPGRIIDTEGKMTGWQHSLGAEDDRDLKFFDALLARLKQDYRVDDKRIYSTGHSNGGAFTFLLWVNRGDVFAAIAPSGAAMSARMGRPKPLPVIELAGETDPLVKYEWQTATMDYIKRINGCERQGKPAGEFCTEYRSATGTPLVTYIHPGGHQFPAAAAKRFVEFFQQHAKK